MAKKTSQKEQALGPETYDTVIVGAGTSGLLAARKFLLEAPESSILVIEAEDRVGGRLSAGGLNLAATADTQKNSQYLQTGPSLESARVRWERQWVEPSQVDWANKEWLGQLPQWTSCLATPQTSIHGLRDADPAAFNVRSRISVRALLRVESPEFSGWKLDCAETFFLARRVIWAAGLTAFQNAVGKLEAQSYLAGNPLYQKAAADFVGGLSLEMTFAQMPTFEEGFNSQALFALPVKHSGMLYLTLGTIENVEGQSHLRTLTHLPNDSLGDPKEMLSLQKSIKRGLKHILSEASKEAAPLRERWVVSPKVAGHTLGSAWVLGRGLPSLLDFVGDETLVSAESGCLDTLAALRSVELLETRSTRVMPPEALPVDLRQ